MKIDRIEVFPIAVPLTEPLVIALGRIDVYAGVLVRAFSGEHYGWGEAAPIAQITGETPGTILAALAEAIVPRVEGRSLWEMETVLADVDASILHNAAAKAAVDIALHDLRGKLLGRSVSQVLGGSAKTLLTSVTLSIGGLDETVAKAEQLAGRGVKLIKLKVGLDPPGDVQRVAAVRRAVGDAPELTLDANQGWSVKDAIWALRRMEASNIAYVEQPVHYRDLRGMAEVRRRVGIPIMADESVAVAADAVEVARADAADMINIKLMKAGGIAAAAKVAAVAEAAAMPCMVGCMKETRLAVTAGVHLAMGLDIVRYADLDGHHNLQTDIVTGGAETLSGTCTMTEGPGLAVDVDDELLARVIQRKEPSP